MTYFVYAAPISITTACFSVKPIPSYNGIFKTSLQHDPRQSLHTKCTRFRCQCIRRCILVLIWITFRVKDYNCRKTKQTLKLKYIDVYRFTVKPKSANHVSQYIQVTINSTRINTTGPSQSLPMTFNTAVMFRSLATSPRIRAVGSERIVDSYSYFQYLTAEQKWPLRN